MREYHLIRISDLKAKALGFAPRFGAKLGAFLFSAALFLTAGCSSVFYQPDQSLYYLPSKFGLAAEEFALKTVDGETIYAWFLPAQKTKTSSKPKGTFVQFHGNAENMSSHYLALAWLVKEGYNLFVFDYHGYGKSTGTPSQETLYQDGLLAMKKAYELHEAAGGGRFIIFGQSLGGAVAARAVQDFKPKTGISLLVLESTFASYKNVATEVLSNHWYSWPFQWLGYLLVSDEYASRDALKQCSSRLLVMHDKRDTAVPFSCGKDVFETASCAPKELWTFDKGRHIGAFAMDEAETRARFLRLLDTLRDALPQ